MNASARTAIARKDASTPMKVAWERGLIGNKILDWGCGRGKDVEWLNNRFHIAKGYDPHFFPELPEYLEWDTITCFYVLNVIDNLEERVALIDSIYKSLPPYGKAIFATRRADEVDKNGEREGWQLKFDGFVTRTGTFQKGFVGWELAGLIRRSAPFVEVETVNSDPLMVVAWKGYNHG